MSNPIRVAQILNRMDSGGIEHITINLYKHLDLNKVQFDFYFNQDSNFPQKEELLSLGAGIYPIPSYTHFISYYKKLKNLLRKNSYNIVHAQLSTMSFFPLFIAWCVGIPIRICHNHTTANWKEGKRTLLKYLFRPLSKLFATHYFACGEYAAKWMYGKDCLKLKNTEIIPISIDYKLYKYDEHARKRLQKELNISPNTFVVGNVGRFVPQKNHYFLLKVFYELSRQRTDTLLLLIGEGKKIDEIKNMSIQLGIIDKIIFAGARNDAEKLYSVMDVFCLPSLYEGMPIVSLEAQANGLPFLCADTVSNEVLLNDNSSLLTIENTQIWVDAILSSKRISDVTFPQIRNIKMTAKKLESFYLTNSITENTL